MPDRMTAPTPHWLEPPRSASGHALPNDFWASFYRTHWEKVGAVMVQPFAKPLAAPGELFTALVAAGDRLRAGDRSVRVEFCIEHAQQLADVGQYLPTQADGSSAGYAERMTAKLEGRRFGLVVEDVQAHDAALWQRLRDFLRGLYAHTGLPGDAAKATVFLGNYDRTPFGLHRGNSGNFMFVVDGEKRMRTWPDAFFRGKEDLTHRLAYEHYNADSIVMDAEPGDVIYWPSDYWHIGESVDGGLSSAVSLALFMSPRSSADMVAHAARLVDRQRASSMPAAGSADNSMSSIDDEVERRVAALRVACDDPRFARAARVSAMNRVTAYGFERSPAPLADVVLAPHAVVRCDANASLLWAHAEGDEIICSANGSAFGISASPKIIALLDRMNGGLAERVDTLTREHAGTVVADGVEFETTADDIHRLLEKLVSLRVLVRD